jgi:hypothetical protein
VPSRVDPYRGILWVKEIEKSYGNLRPISKFEILNRGSLWKRFAEEEIPQLISSSGKLVWNDSPILKMVNSCCKYIGALMPVPAALERHSATR